jgi:sulfide:quinone oxidoreductase
MPKGVTWIRGAAAAVDPAAQRVTTESGQVLGYDYLVTAPGLQLDFDRVPGLR